jgi:hypothetical protein
MMPYGLSKIWFVLDSKHETSSLRDLLNISMDDWDVLWDLSSMSVARKPNNYKWIVESSLGFSIEENTKWVNRKKVKYYRILLAEADRSSYEKLCPNDEEMMHSFRATLKSTARAADVIGRDSIRLPLNYSNTT